MARIASVTCDLESCGKDITRGNGRLWRLFYQSEMIEMDPTTTRRVDAMEVTQQHHFCDENCMIAYLTIVAADREKRQAEFIARQRSPLSSAPSGV